MKKINTSTITSTKGMLFEKKQIDFLQENVRYVTENIAYTALNAKNLNAVILWGCVPTFSTVGFANDTLTITEGAVQYNGTIYRVDAKTVTRSVIGNVHYLEIAPVDTSEGNPSTFTDSTTANTQENTKIRLAQGLSGGGIVDWVNVDRVVGLPVSIGGGFYARKEGNQLRITGEQSNISALQLTTFATNIIDGIEPNTGIDRIFTNGDSVSSFGITNGTPKVNLVTLALFGSVYALSIDATIGNNVFLDCSFSLKTQ